MMIFRQETQTADLYKVLSRLFFAFAVKEMRKLFELIWSGMEYIIIFLCIPGYGAMTLIFIVVITRNSLNAFVTSVYFYELCM